MSVKQITAHAVSLAIGSMVHPSNTQMESWHCEKSRKQINCTYRGIPLKLSVSENPQSL